MSWPPLDAQASTAAASFGDMPERFISGIVTTPTATVFAAAMPEIMPKRLEPTTAILAAPAAIATHQRDGDVVEEARAARAHEQLAHQHERDDDDHRDLQDEAEQAVVVEVEVGEQLAELHLARLQLAGHEVPDQHVAAERRAG